MILMRINKNTILLKEIFEENKNKFNILPNKIEINEIIEDLNEENIYVDKNDNLHIKEIKETQVLE